MSPAERQVVFAAQTAAVRQSKPLPAAASFPSTRLALNAFTPPAEGSIYLDFVFSDAQLPVGEYDEAKLTVSLVRTSAQGMVNDSLELPIKLVYHPVCQIE